MPLRPCIYLLLCLFTLLLATGCAHNKPVTEENVSAVPSEYTPIEVPAWLVELPIAESSIGIAWNNSLSAESAREYAAVSLSRNHCSFVVDKSAWVDYAGEQTTANDISRFQVTVSADTTYLHKVNGSLIPLADATFQGYKLTLFGTQQCDISKQKVRLNYSDRPSWCVEGVQETDDGVVATGYAQSHDLIEAWKLAQEAALRKSAQYRLMKVSGAVQSCDDVIQKKMLIETVVQNHPATLTKSWFFSRKQGNANTYGVFLQLKSDKI